MRTTVSIPDEYYGKCKGIIAELGYQTINEFILDLIRHHFDEEEVDVKRVKHQIDAIPKEVSAETQERVVTKLSRNDSLGTFCKHGHPRALCEHQECSA